MYIRSIGITPGDLESIVKNLKWHVVAIITVVIIRSGLARLGHSPDNLQVSSTPQLEIFRSRPPIERLLIMLPGLRPILRIAPRPPKIAERFLGLGPDTVVVFRLLPGADQRFKLLSGRFVFCVIGILRGGLPSPKRIGQAELDPSGFVRR